MTRTTLAALALVSTLLAGSSIANTVPLGPAFPPPYGSVDVAGSGLGPADAGGFTWSYTNFGIGSLTGLWQGLDLAYPPSAGLDGTLSPLSYAGISGQTATWSGTTTWYDSTDGVTPIATPVRLQLTVIGTPGWVALPLGGGINFDPSLGAVIDNSAGADYDLLQEVEAFISGSWVPLNSVPQHPIRGGGQNVSSYSLGFYSIPEPSSIVLAVCGVAGVAVAFGRRIHRRVR